MKNNNELVVAGYSSGASDPTEITHAIEDAWSTIRADPALSEEALHFLTLPMPSLPKNCPYKIHAAEAGLGIVEAAVLIVVTDFVREIGYDLLKEVTKDAVKEALRSLWQSFLKYRIEDRLPVGGIGKEIHLPDDIQ